MELACRRLMYGRLSSLPIAAAYVRASGAGDHNFSYTRSEAEVVVYRRQRSWRVNHASIMPHLSHPRLSPCARLPWVPLLSAELRWPASQALYAAFEIPDGVSKRVRFEESPKHKKDRLESLSYLLRGSKACATDCLFARLVLTFRQNLVQVARELLRFFPMRRVTGIVINDQLRVGKIPR